MSEIFPDTDDIVRRLRALAQASAHSGWGFGDGALETEAADIIERLDAYGAEMERHVIASRLTWRRLLDLLDEQHRRFTAALLPLACRCPEGHCQRGTSDPSACPHRGAAEALSISEVK